MKTLSTFFLILLIASQVVYAGGDPKDKPKENSPASAVIVANKLLDAFNHYRQKDIGKCKSNMIELNFLLSKEMKRPISGSSTIDSLIFENDDVFRWAYYKSVDLNYLRDVEAFFVLKHPESDEIAIMLSEQLTRFGTDVITRVNVGEEQFKIDIKESVGVHVVDERFPAKPVSKLSSLYRYRITSDGEYVIIELKETIPTKTIKIGESIVTE